LATKNLKQILIAPLDWGLGHTTRCIPLMRHLRASGHSVTLAGNENQRSFIEETFPGIETIHLEGYNVSYGSTAGGFMFSIFKQIPGLLKAIRLEHDWLARITKTRHFDGIISDNRYGLFHSTIPSVFITHQLQVRTGMGDATDGILRNLHYRYINRFRQCWVADLPEAPGLGGSLSHPNVLPARTEYLGLLSQFTPVDDRKANDAKHLLILLSGPEPQRTLLSGFLWDQVKDHEGKVVFVEGSGKAAAPPDIPPQISYYKQLTAGELTPLLQQAEMVICRSGYSTLMDLVAFGKKAILIPTPGQTEQEYLAKKLKAEGRFLSTTQKSFDLQDVLKQAMSFPFKAFNGALDFTKHQEVMDNWIRRL
jgi:UDP:flavonoid glycosyltransferase YjiC (YdhE family)